MSFILILVYLGFCVLVAYGGRASRVGFLGVLFLSVFFTPLLTAILVLLFQSRKEEN
jgi:hypothetical protein